ncbi:PqiC family protein [Paraburkholderia phymatum]|uniref:PqiC family protein n=1 Tax=Paraburkholderia phymatum TaxID=148447 RepID=UPI00317A0E20
MSFSLHTALADLAAASTLMLAACASAPVHYYTLVQPRPSRSAVTVSAAAPFAVDVFPVGVPAQLDQQQLVVRESGGSVAVLDGERWVSPLGDELRSAISSGVVDQLGTYDIAGLPRPQDRAVVTIRVQIRRLDAWAGRSVQLEADWSTGVRQKAGNARVTCHTYLEKATQGGYPEMVRAQQQVVGLLASQIATAARSVASSGNAACPAA